MRMNIFLNAYKSLYNLFMVLTAYVFYSFFLLEYYFLINVKVLW